MVGQFRVPISVLFCPPETKRLNYITDNVSIDYIIEHSFHIYVVYQPSQCGLPTKHFILVPFGVMISRFTWKCCPKEYSLHSMGFSRAFTLVCLRNVLAQDECISVVIQVNSIINCSIRCDFKDHFINNIFLYSYQNTS